MKQQQIENFVVIHLVWFYRYSWKLKINTKYYAHTKENPDFEKTHILKYFYYCMWARMQGREYNVSYHRQRNLFEYWVIGIKKSKYVRHHRNYINLLSITQNESYWDDEMFKIVVYCKLPFSRISIYLKHIRNYDKNMINIRYSEVMPISIL